MARETQELDLVAAAAGLAPGIRAVRDELETLGHLPGCLVEALDRAGLFQLYLPRSMGGTETDPITGLCAIEELSKVDGSVGWCAVLSSFISGFSAWLDPEVAKSLFGQPPGVRCAGSIRPMGVARIVDGGYVVSGRWDFASGIDHATVLLCTCKLVDGQGPRLTADGVPETIMFLAPKGAAKIHNTWSVMGMRGTGSNDFELEEVFMPEEHSFSMSEPPRESGQLYHPRMFLTAGWSLNAGNALGIARGAMDAFVELANQAGSTSSATLLRDRSSVQRTVGEAEAIISAARAYLIDAVGKAWQAVGDGSPDPSPQIAQARLAITHAVRESVRAVDLLFHGAGTNAVYQKHPLERYFRDIHMAVQHLAGLPAVFESAGQVLLGLRPDGPGW
ncbi:MAG: acyl-CoA dehydrogenase family protein [Chloroflexi bacterium]|nr:acyl-CoA dehydrogenase family protein [Chloroflexota bacterium]